MKEHNPRFFADHVRVDRYDIDTRFAKRLQGCSQIIFGDREVTIVDSVLALPQMPPNC